MLFQHAVQNETSILRQFKAIVAAEYGIHAAV